MSQIVTDQSLLDQFTKKAMEEPEVVIKTRAPSEPEVVLPGGFINKDGALVTTAEVRELTGFDEEAVAKASSTGKALAALVQRGLVKLGNSDVTKDDLSTLLSGDRDMILLGIRKLTFGNTLPLIARCLSCNTEQSVEIDLTADVPVQTLDDPIADRRWDIETSQGVVSVALPNGIVQQKLLDEIDKTGAEVNTILLTGCITAVDGSPTFGTGPALSLSMGNRAKIIEQIVERNPGPRLGEVKKVCKVCESDMNLPLSLADLFPL
ncbi:hypothetical protein UFOVP965_30 [uncultured Caudovirales phage]|uniref:Uncharacterized protein n=1 Tax=uncultured Caudovirales phage TaxID=2100421 RepID=A0A6J5Q661_9CAUD|nr:hypothetical protein UFOVP965_30 [uncultured Caudovirales phage]CAB4179739.1 hypothetical protein UFOVP1035_26 [uncultured Caudovirales phage]CAB4188855.1 hypothetical protein UFOVP1181_132 [uncultured Caudovirales phage]